MMDREKEIWVDVCEGCDPPKAGDIIQTSSADAFYCCKCGRMDFFGYGFDKRVKVKVKHLNTIEPRISGRHNDGGEYYFDEWIVEEVE